MHSAKVARACQVRPALAAQAGSHTRAQPQGAGTASSTAQEQSPLQQPQGGTLSEEDAEGALLEELELEDREAAAAAAGRPVIMDLRPPPPPRLDAAAAQLRLQQLTGRPLRRAHFAPAPPLEVPMEAPGSVGSQDRQQWHEGGIVTVRDLRPRQPLPPVPQLPRRAFAEASMLFSYVFESHTSACMCACCDKMVSSMRDAGACAAALSAHGPRRAHRQRRHRAPTRRAARRARASGHTRARWRLQGWAPCQIQSWWSKTTLW